MQETSRTGFTEGVCGKTADVSNLQDLLIYVIKGLSFIPPRLAKRGLENEKANYFIVDILFDYY